MRILMFVSISALVCSVWAKRSPMPLEVPLERVGTLVPRTAPDPKDDQWMIGYEVLDRDFAKFAAYKDYLPQLGIRSIRLQGRLNRLVSRAMASQKNSRKNK